MAPQAKAPAVKHTVLHLLLSKAGEEWPLQLQSLMAEQNILPQKWKQKGQQKTFV